MFGSSLVAKWHCTCPSIQLPAKLHTFHSRFYQQSLIRARSRLAACSCVERRLRHLGASRGPTWHHTTKRFILLTCCIPCRTNFWASGVYCHFWHCWKLPSWLRLTLPAHLALKSCINAIWKANIFLWLARCLRHYVTAPEPGCRVLADDLFTFGMLISTSAHDLVGTHLGEQGLEFNLHSQLQVLDTWPSYIAAICSSMWLKLLSIHVSFPPPPRWAMTSTPNWQS